MAVNLFHLRGGRVVDRRDFYWEDLDEFDPAEFLPSLLKQLYLDAAYLPRYIHTPIGFRGSCAAGRSSDRSRRPPRGNSESAARAEARVSRACGEQREAFVHAALSRAAAKLENNCRGAGIRALVARAAETHRKLRHFAHSGFRHGGVDGRLGRRQDEKVRLPEIHHSRRGDAGRLGESARHPARRFRQHARGGRAALPAFAGREQTDAKPDPD